MSGLTFDEYVSHDAVGLASLVAKGEVKPTELIEAAIARAEAVNPTINAVVERLYEPARAAAQDKATGPLAGVPYAIKDLGHPIAGVRVTGGSRAFRDYVAPVDSETCTRARAAGLIPFCTSTTPEFGITVTTESALFGPTRNPWNPTYSAGGSSGGAAALVAAGVLPAAHATDGGGSIRIPASCCGLFGLKVSRGRTPVGVGRTEGWNGLGVSHAVTRSVRDSAAILDATHGAPFGARSVAPPPKGTYVAAAARDPRPLRIALQLEPFGGTEVHPECLAAVRDAAKLCQDLGHRVEEARPDLPDALGDHLLNVIATHTAMSLDLRAKELGRPLADDEVEPITALTAAKGRTLTGLDIVAADNAFMRTAIAMAEFLSTYDVILSTTLGAPPVRLGMLSLDRPPAEYGTLIRQYSPFTATYNITGQPAMSVPLAMSSEGTPIGIHFAGRLGEEELLLSLAGQLERARPWFARRAPI
ncbi:amidase [Chelatococcus reniformis]|uniref:Indoleacetamide hydrolase n=1 Tax=Chelatococcus reniformis TaxID=1494448 RepID=A0A916X9X1_9HYPH|nr:amidase family protein [Chelatococcus reniformis]GGC55682.1 6-aminohexanoate-cyclic-dimer hydrolase [Chelatococcus reniformis]